MDQIGWKWYSAPPRKWRDESTNAARVREAFSGVEEGEQGLTHSKRRSKGWPAVARWIKDDNCADAVLATVMALNAPSE